MMQEVVAMEFQGYHIAAETLNDFSGELDNDDEDEVSKWIIDLDREKMPLYSV